MVFVCHLFLKTSMSPLRSKASYMPSMSCFQLNTLRSKIVSENFRSGSNGRAQADKWAFWRIQNLLATVFRSESVRLKFKHLLESCEVPRAVASDQGHIFESDPADLRII
jgi:hypothetical protein